MLVLKVLVEFLTFCRSRLTLLLLWILKLYGSMAWIFRASTILLGWPGKSHAYNGACQGLGAFAQSRSEKGPREGDPCPVLA